MNNDKPTNPVDVVLLEALSEGREKVLEFTIPVEDYYNDSHPLIDEDAYRNELSIRFVNGRIYNHEGQIDQEFKNEYDSQGIYIRSKIVFADGSISED